jgi:complex iron-sulfur molybdoenzyme family reductase subunit beta
VSYLESLFGAGTREALKTVEAEMEKRKKGQPSELMDILIAYKHADMFRIAETPQQLMQIERRPKAAVAGKGKSLPIVSQP